jgi:hypothetical protein
MGGNLRLDFSLARGVGARDYGQSPDIVVEFSGIQYAPPTTTFGLALSGYCE